MSNVNPKPLKVVVVKDELMDWVEPVYTINGPSSLKSFNAQDIQTYSNNYINATLNLNSSDFIVDPAILWKQPVTITISGSSSAGNNLLLNGCFALRSDPLAKITNTIELKIGSTSNTTQIGDVVSALERYNNYTYDKFINNFGLSYLDNTQSYDDLVGAPKNPLGLFSTGTDIIEPRGSWPMTITNGTTSAIIETTLSQLVPIAPLVDKLRRDGSPVQGLSHLNNLGFNITFYANAGNRILSLAQNRPSGDVLTVTNITVEIGHPVFSFVQLKSRNESIPPVLAYPLVSQERYPFSLPAIAQNASYTFNVASFNLTRVPHSLLCYARASNNVLLNSVSGVFCPDTFCRLSNMVLNYDGQTLFGQSINENMYQMAVLNGISDTWTAFNGLPVIKSVNDGSVIYPSGSVFKFEFGRDISLFPGTVIGSYNECAISLQVTITNISPLSALAQAGGLEFYMVMLYSDVIELYGNNLAQISNIPVGAQDVMNAESSEKVHRVNMRNPDVTGSGLLSSIGNFLKSPKLLGVVRTMKEAFSSPAGKQLRDLAKSTLRSRGHSGIANSLESLGFGDESMDGGRKKAVRRRRGGAISGGDYDGGAYASMSDLAESLYE